MKTEPDIRTALESAMPFVEAAKRDCIPGSYVAYNQCREALAGPVAAQVASADEEPAEKQALALCYQIEECGSSPALTKASIMASALYMRIIHEHIANTAEAAQAAYVPLEPGEVISEDAVIFNSGEAVPSPNVGEIYRPAHRHAGHFRPINLPQAPVGDERAPRCCQGCGGTGYRIEGEQGAQYTVSCDECNDTGSERSAFESWARNRFKLKRMAGADGYYFDTTNFCWKAWQARAALDRGGDAPSIPAPPGFTLLPDDQKNGQWITGAQAYWKDGWTQVQKGSFPLITSPWGAYARRGCLIAVPEQPQTPHNERD